MQNTQQKNQPCKQHSKPQRRYALGLKRATACLLSAYLVSACSHQELNEYDARSQHATKTEQLPASEPAPTPINRQAHTVTPVGNQAHAEMPEQEAEPLMQSRPMVSARKRSLSPAADSYMAAEVQAMAGYQPIAPIQQPVAPPSRENYQHFADNPIHRVSEQPVSTFSIDVDTGSYANVRRMLNHGQLPPYDAVRAEELINYFDYTYPAPINKSRPFSVHTELAASPWNSHTQLMLVGIQGYQVPKAELPAANLVFLIDVSGSMNNADKLGLLKKSMRLLSKQLDEDDRVSIVVYAGASGVVLEPTAGNESRKINRAFASLRAGGSTNGAAGIQAAYELAEEAFIPDGINRILLATDGDFNVGMTNFEQLKQLVAEKRKSGISLTTLGFGTGNYNDHLMEQLADTGNGNYSYIDTLNEANKVLVKELGSTLLTIAKDVKIQVEFNPALVSEYRLVGYENRALRREDFNNDKVDAGEIGAGHSVTALYEIALVGSGGERMDDLRYGVDEAATSKHGKLGTTNPQSNNEHELAFLRLRYKAPNADTSRLIEQAITSTNDSVTRHSGRVNNGSENLRHAAAVAGFAQLLRGGKHTEGFDFTKLKALAVSARGKDANGYRGEFIRLIDLAGSLSASLSQSSSPQAQAAVSQTRPQTKFSSRIR